MRKDKELVGYYKNAYKRTVGSMLNAKLNVFAMDEARTELVDYLLQKQHTHAEILSDLELYNRFIRVRQKKTKAEKVLEWCIFPIIFLAVSILVQGKPFRIDDTMIFQCLIISGILNYKVYTKPNLSLAIVLGLLFVGFGIEMILIKYLPPFEIRLSILHVIAFFIASIAIVTISKLYSRYQFIKPK